jgi:hypothetical protein
MRSHSNPQMPSHITPQIITMKAMFLGIMITCMAAVSSASGTLVTAEYFIDMDPGQGNGIQVQLPYPDGSASIPIDVPASVLAGLSVGHHHLGVRFQNGGGEWSETIARTFSKDPTNTPPPERFLERVEYQWHDANGPVGDVFSASAPAGRAVHTWLPELPMAPGNEGDVFRLVITPYDTQGGRGDSITRNVRLAPQAFPNATPQNRGPAGNPLGDTLNNIQKYFLGLEPTRRNGGTGLSVMAAPPSGTGGMAPRGGPRSLAETHAPVTLHYTRNRYARNVTGTVEASTSLAGGSWAPVEATEEVTPIDPYTDRVTLRPVPPADTGGGQFYRLKVSETP